MIILKNCRLIPELTEGYEGEYADILVEDGKIAQIAAPGRPYPGDAEIIDCEGCTVLPGFFDLHCHLCYDKLDDYSSMNDKAEAYTTMDCYNFAKAYLRQGYTTLRDAGTLHSVTAKLTRMAKAGVIDPIPDILSTCRALTPTNPSNDEYIELYEVCDGPDEVRKAVRKQFENGADLIKFMATGCFLDESGNPGITIVTEDELRAAVEIAEMRGTYVMAHAHGADGIKKCIRAGVHTVEHCSFIDDEAIEMFKNSSSYMVATGAIGLACMSDGSEDALSEAVMQKAIDYEKLERDSVDHAYECGLKIGFGSDIDMDDFVRNPGMEFRARTEWYHFKPLDILLQATKYSAEIAMMDDVKGTVKAGKNAELVVIEGKPDEDIYAMTRMPRYVVFRDVVIRN
ncbi:MAG: amidohydrolase family protein [Firmicutes bacterium]|nr:amidohydrolase family protein [Bacillota bacterium]